MIPYGGVMKAHRVFDPEMGYYNPTIRARLPRWRPVTGGTPASVKACVVPGYGDAVARWLYDDPISGNSSFFNAHITPSGTDFEVGQPVRYPRYIYVVGGFGSVGDRPSAPLTGGDGYDLGSQLLDRASEITGSGARLVFGLPLDIWFYQAMGFAAPIAGGSATDLGNGAVNVNLQSEDSNYDAGEVFVAMVVDGRFGRLLYNTEMLGVGGQGTYTGACTTVIPDGYTVIETAGDDGEFKLAINSSLADSDNALAQPHIQRHKKYTQKFYLPESPVSYASDLEADEFLNWTTGWPSLLAAVNSPGWPSSEWSDYNNLASQIVSDAIQFFTS